MKESEPKDSIRTVVFGEGLLNPTLIGEKQISLRKYRAEAHDFKEGELFIGNFMDGLDILLRATRDTEVKRFDELTDEDVIADGFLDTKHAFEGMKRYYPNLTPETVMGIIRYEIAKVNGIPVVKTNDNFFG